MKKIFTKAASILLIVSLVLVSGCSSKTSVDTGSGQDDKISVFTSFYTMYDFTKKIGGDKINITNLIPTGTEPHEWEPAPVDIVKLEHADLLIYNGAGMERWIDKVLNTVSNKKLTVVETSKAINFINNPSNNKDIKFDPHVWLNPINAEKQMEAIKNALVSVDPANKEYYEKNYNENKARLDSLDKEYRDAVSKFSKKDVVVTHQAFRYLCQAYGLKQVAIEGLNADSDPTPAKMTEITKFIRDNNVRYVFYEELISPRAAEIIAKEAGAKTAALNPLEGISEDKLKAGKEYISVMKDNLEALKQALN